MDHFSILGVHQYVSPNIVAYKTSRRWDGPTDTNHEEQETWLIQNTSNTFKAF